MGVSLRPIPFDPVHTLTAIICTNIYDHCIDVFL